MAPILLRKQGSNPSKWGTGEVDIKAISASTSSRAKKPDRGIAALWPNCRQLFHYFLQIVGGQVLSGYAVNQAHQ